MQLSKPSLQERSRRARWRAWHRGMQELDIILGRFADQRVTQMTDGELTDFEKVLECEDSDLYGWLVRGLPVPQHLLSKVFEELLALRAND